MSQVAVADLHDEIINLAAEHQFDPDGWAHVAWDWGQGDLDDLDGPREWQSDINGKIRAHLSNPETRFQPLQIAVASGHGIGKSAEMGMLSNWAMSCWDDAKVLVTANTDTQLRTKTVPEVSKWFRTSITADWFDIQATSVKSLDKGHADSWRLDFTPWSQHNTEAFAGLHNKGKIVLILFDEASKIHDKVWEVTEGALTDEDTVIIWVVFGNPTQAAGRFRECFRRFRHRWVTRQIDSRTVPGTNKKKLQEWVDDYGEDSDFVKVRVRGMFPSMSFRQFISEDDVDAAYGRHLTETQYEFAPVVIGVDPAWTGEDEFVIVKRQGLYSEVLGHYEKTDNDVHMAQVIARFEDEHNAKLVNVDAGYGTGIVSAGRTMGRHWNLIWFGGKPADLGCLNKRAEMWKEMRDWLKSGGAIPPDDVLRTDLTGPETVPRADGRIQLESKEDMKRRMLPSPNRADALGLTFAMRVRDTAVGKTRAGSQVAEHDFDPYA